MGIINRSGTYYAEFFDATRTPKAKRFSLKTKNKGEARRKYVELEKDRDDGVFDPWEHDPRTYKRSLVEARQRAAQRPQTFGAAVESFLNQKRAAGKSDNTLRTYGEVLSITEKCVGKDARLTHLRAAHFEPVVRDPAVSGATRHKRFGHLRVFVRWMLKEKMIEANPLEGVEPPRKPHKLPKSVTEDELQAVCIAVVVDYQEKRETGYIQEGDLVWRIPLMLFAFCTGMRASELARLRWGHLDFDKRLITIHVQKNGKEQTIPLNARAVAVLDMVKRGGAEDYVFTPPGNGGSKRTVRPFVERASKAFTAARKLAGINRRITFHGLRHGFCTKLAEAGKPLYVIKEAARHADVSTSMLYVHMANEHLKSELDDVFG